MRQPAGATFGDLPCRSATATGTATKVIAFLAELPLAATHSLPSGAPATAKTMPKGCLVVAVFELPTRPAGGAGGARLAATCSALAALAGINAVVAATTAIAAMAATATLPVVADIHEDEALPLRVQHIGGGSGPAELAIGRHRAVCPSSPVGSAITSATADARRSGTGATCAATTHCHGELHAWLDLDRADNA